MPLQRQASVEALARAAAADFIRAFDKMKDAQTQYDALQGKAAFDQGLYAPGNTEEISSDELYAVMVCTNVLKDFFDANPGRLVDLYKARG